jgi:hypothetical protein
MSQPFDPTLQNIESPEEVRIRRMLAYKSLIISILQRSCFFLLLIAFIIAAIVLFLLHRQGQKNFFRKRSSLDLIYDPKVSKNQGIAPISIMNVFQVLSTGAVKEDAGNTAQIPADKFGYLGRALEASLDRNTTNTLTLIVTWDDEKEIAQLLNAYAGAAKNAYVQYREKVLKEQLKNVNKQITSLEKEINQIDDKTQKLSRQYPASLQQEQDKYQNRVFRLEEEVAGYAQQKARLNQRLEIINQSNKEVDPKKQAIIKANYKYFMDLIKQRDEALIRRNKIIGQYKPEHPDAVIAEKELKDRQSLVERVLGHYKIAEEEILNVDSDYIDIQSQFETLDQLITTTQEKLLEAQKELMKLRNMNQEANELQAKRAEKSKLISDNNAKKAEIDLLMEQAKNELDSFTPPKHPISINGLGPKQYIIALFAGCVFASFIAVIIILLAAQFGCISTATELHDMAEIEVFSLSESELKKLEPAELSVAAHNVFYVLNQMIEDRQYVFYGALQGSYSTAILFEQLLLQFAMNGTRIFVLNLEPYDANSEATEEEENENTPEDPISEELLGIEKNSDTGVFRLGNASFISPNELEILKMDLETLLKHYDKIIFRRKSYFTGKELMFKQVITLTQCCVFSVGKKRSPRSFLKLLRDNKTSEQTIITGIFTEP